jgi:HSP20 family protein
MAYTASQSSWYRQYPQFPQTGPIEFNPRFYEEFGTYPSFKGTRNWVPYVNCFDNGKFFELWAELPGYDEKSVEVLLRDSTLTIRCNKGEEFSGDCYYYIHECNFGSFTRSIALPFEPDPTSMKVTFEKGILKISWPMTVEMKGKSIKLPVHH